jgi:hypothetical protein
VFRRISFLERVLEFLFPWCRRAREAVLDAEIRRLVHEAPQEPVFYRD